MLVVGFCRHRLIMFNLVHDLISFTATVDPVTQLTTVIDRLADIVVGNMKSQNVITSCRVAFLDVLRRQKKKYV